MGFTLVLKIENQLTCIKQPLPFSLFSKMALSSYFCRISSSTNGILPSAVVFNMTPIDEFAPVLLRHSIASPELRKQDNEGAYTDLDCITTRRRCCANK